jgi:membrane associated rhomboid family serine protease
MPASTTMATSTESTEAFAVDFSIPGASSWLTPQPANYWKLVGSGAVVFRPARIELRGRKNRVPGFGAQRSIEIPLTDISNVVQEGRIVQCHVRILNSSTKILRFWAADATAAQRLAGKLPQQRSPDFERRLNEQKTFQAALQNTGTRSVVTPTLVALNCLVFVWTAFAGAGILKPNAIALVHWGTNFGPLTLNGEWWRLFTSMFLHFGAFHLLLNMWALWNLGRITERLFGSAHFLLLYVFAGLCGSIVSLLWHPGINSAGASGAIFGVLGGQLAFVLNPQTRVPGSISKSMATSAAVFIAYNLANGFGHTGIDNGAHLGGLLGGFAIGWVLARPLHVESREGATQHLALTCLGAIVVLVALSWPLAHPDARKAAEWDFRRQFQRYLEDEGRIIAAQSALGRLETAKKISHREWGQRMEEDILPQWQAAEARLASPHLPPESNLGRLQAGLLDYLEEKRSGLELLSEAGRDNDSGKLRKGAAILARNNARVNDLSKLVKAAY